MQPHRKLDVWQLSTDFVIQIYKMIESFPKVETYGLADQLRRVSISIPSNIAEGSARNTYKEKIQFLYIARWSCSEIDTQLYLANKLDYISDEKFAEINEYLDRIWKMLTGLIHAIKKRTNTKDLS